MQLAQPTLNMLVTTFLATCVGCLLLAGKYLVSRIVSLQVTVTTQARQEIRIWRGLTQRHMGVRGRTVT
jgi:hypothetical protein